MNIYAYIAIIVLLLGVGYWLDSNGYDRAIANQAIAERAQLKEDADKIEVLRKEKKADEKIVKTLNAKLKKLASTDKCLNTPWPTDFTAGVRDSYSRITRSKAH